VIPFGLCIWSTGVGPTPFTLSLPFLKTSKGRVAVDEFLRVMAPPRVDAAGHVHGQGDAPPGPQQLSHVSMLQEEALGDGAPSGAPLHEVYALGDCCASGEHALPALAQVAEQQGRYLASRLNEAAARVEAPTAREHQPFVYRPLGSMATVGARPLAWRSGGLGGRRRWMQRALPARCARHRSSAARFLDAPPAHHPAGGRAAVIQLDGASSRLSWAGFASWVAWRSAYLTRLGTMKHRLYVMTNWTLTLLFGRCGRAMAGRRAEAARPEALRAQAWGTYRVPGPGQEARLPVPGRRRRRSCRPPALPQGHLALVTIPAAANPRALLGQRAALCTFRQPAAPERRRPVVLGHLECSPQTIKWLWPVTRCARPFLWPLGAPGASQACLRRRLRWRWAWPGEPPGGP
jgi:hypothetical protein